MERKIMAVALSSTLALSTLIACTSAKSDTSSGSKAGSIVSSFDYICSDAACFEGVSEADYGYYEEELVFNTEEYDAIDENGFRKVSVSPLSTFSADVDTASYSNLRRMLNDGYSIEEIPQGAVRAEEMINYFTYDYNGPEEGEPFGVNAEISTCPWNSEHDLLMLGLQTQAIDFEDAADSNIVLLIDVSGSMYSENKLPLLKESFELLIDNLTEKDSVSIVTYASGVNEVINGVPASDKDTIIDALTNLQAGGGTNGEGGIQLAYELAEENFIKGGNNRVIIATDGDFNIGVSSQSDLSKLIKEKSKSGIYLSVLGFGMGNYSDSRMETLADDGNGNYAYIDSISEAKKVLVEELGATMVTVAKDVKLQVEFNPAFVSEYRLIGYEDRLMADEDFEDDKKDAGEIGAGHSVTVMYEIVPTSDEDEVNGNLKYQSSTLTDEAINSNEWITLSVRYKEPDEDESKLLEYPIGGENYNENTSDDFKFASAVAEFAMILRDSEYIADGSLKQIMDELKDMNLEDEYREEFEELVLMTKLRNQ